MLLGGEDTAEVALYIRWDEDWEKNCELFNQCKADAADGDKGEGGFFDLGGWTCQVAPGGSRGKSGLYRAYVLTSLGMRFEFCRRAEPAGDCPNGKLVIGSTTLIRLGFKEAWAKAREFIEALGGNLVGNKLSRIDACLDMLGLEMSAFADPFLRGEFTCRSHEDHNHRSNRKTSSFAIGKDPKCRIYDKAKELRDNPDPLKYEAMVELRWGGTHPKVAPRVEWQIRRDTIKSFGVDSVEDWLERRQGVIDYLFEWLRFVDTGGRPFKAKNAERYPTLPVWLQACEGFAGWASSDVKQVVRNTKSGGQAPPAKLREIAGGCLLASHAQTATEWRGFGEFLEYSIRELSAWWLKFKDDEIGKRWLRKRRELQVKKPPNSNRRLGVRPKIVPFNTWLNELIDKREAIETAGGQLPFDFPWDGFDLSQLHKIVGD